MNADDRLLRCCDQGDPGMHIAFIGVHRRIQSLDKVASHFVPIRSAVALTTI
jgi:hypothetical protein